METGSYGRRREGAWMIVLDGESVTCADVAAIGRREATARIGEAGRDRAEAAARTMRTLTEQAVASGVAIYGRTTGVGFNRSIEVSLR